MARELRDQEMRWNGGEQMRWLIGPANISRVGRAVSKPSETASSMSAPSSTDFPYPFLSFYNLDLIIIADFINLMNLLSLLISLTFGAGESTFPQFFGVCRSGVLLRIRDLS